jgi:hypothetical protein
MHYSALAAAAVVPLLVMSPALAEKTHTIPLRSQYGFRQHGEAVLTETGRNLTIAITVNMTPGEAPEFVHIHRGSCAHLGSPMSYDLEPIRNGRSTTVLQNAGFASFAGGPYSIVVHRTLAHVSMHIACGGPIPGR